jgi:hypothetical protein
MKANRHTTAKIIVLSVLLFTPCGVARLHAHEVFIYYANETSPDKASAANYSVIGEWLKSSGSAKALEISDQLERDQREFPAVMEREISALEIGLPHAQPRLRAMIFTNRLVRSGYYRVLNDGVNGFVEAEFRILPHRNYILNCNPLSRPDVFRLVMEEVAHRFDPQTHEFVLITKSHGNRDKAMVPRLVVRHEETNREEILAVANGELGDDQLPEWSGSMGVTKNEYFSILADAGREHGMHFSLVVMESCHGDINDELTQELPQNVGRLYNSGPRGAEYSNLNYDDLLSRYDTSHSIAELISDTLTNRFQTLHHKRHPFPYFALVFFVPFVAWIAWFIIRRVRAKKSELLHQ